MGLIDDYEQQYSQLTAEATALIGRLSVASGGDKRQLIQNIDTLLQEAGETLEQIGLEIRDSDPGARPGLTYKLNCYNAELKRLQNEFTMAKSNKNTVNAGFDDDEYDDVNVTEDQKRRLLDNSERLERSGNQLTNAYRIAVETEEIGNSVLRDLENQRETLTRARGRLRDTDAELGRSGRLLNTMIMRHMRDKFVLIGIGAVFLLVICVSVYFSFTKKEKTH
ncbi:vesicle transport through interaction with t-SNAREs homolog 1A-like [Culicoides brevitarsis]|uniref:vesicle transport through interaction with t-SNAREs homolog 1A-like n=1 Tax=Culicoides brevitarsis TaxID=469753 RepID=UPI00307C57A1